jgi:type IV pilus assembly protein PilZ
MAEAKTQLPADKLSVAHPGVFAVSIRNKPSLYAAYIPLLRNGGLFVPTGKTMKLGEEVLLLLSLMEEQTRYPVAGKVAWITPQNAHGNRPPGIGVQFADSDAMKALRRKIEGHLGGALQSSSKPTHTL